MGGLIDELDAALAPLTALFDTAVREVSEPVVAVDAQQREALLHDLREQLLRSDTRAIDLFEERPETWRAILGDDFERLGGLIECFDFDGALATLEQLSFPQDPVA